MVQKACMKRKITMDILLLRTLRPDHLKVHDMYRYGSGRLIATTTLYEIRQG